MALPTVFPCCLFDGHWAPMYGSTQWILPPLDRGAGGECAAMAINPQLWLSHVGFTPRWVVMGSNPHDMEAGGGFPSYWALNP